MAQRLALFLIAVTLLSSLSACVAPVSPAGGTKTPTPIANPSPTRPLATPTALPMVVPTVVVSTPPTAVKTPAVTPTPSVMALKLYFNNDKLAEAGGACNKVFPVNRTVPKTVNVATAALGQLFAGPTQEETAKGYTSVFSDKTKDILKSIKIIDGVAYINLADLRSLVPNASTSCGAAMLLAEADSTLKQFSTIKKTIYAIEGKPATFYTWLQLSCGPDNNNCDETPFKQ